MTLTTYLKAAAKTVAAATVGFLAARGVEIDSQALEIVVTGLFLGLGSIAINLALVLLQKSPIAGWVERFLPTYEPK